MNKLHEEIETKLQEIETEHEELRAGVMDAIPECGGNEDIEELVGHLLTALLHAQKLAIMTGAPVNHPGYTWPIVGANFSISKAVEAGWAFAEGER